MIEKEAREMSSTQELAEPPPKRQRQETKGLMLLLEDVVNTLAEGTAQPSDEQEAKKEIHKYMCLDSATGNQMKWWLDNEKHFPLLARIAPKYLCVPATSAPSERAFSVAG